MECKQKNKARSVQICDKHGKLKRVARKKKKMLTVASVITCAFCGSILAARMLDSLPGCRHIADSWPSTFVFSCSLPVCFIASDELSSAQVVDYWDDSVHKRMNECITCMYCMASARVGAAGSWQLATCTRFTIPYIFSTGVYSFGKLTQLC